MDSHPFFFGLHPFIAFFAIEDVDPDFLGFSSLHNRLSGSLPVTLRFVHVRIVALFSQRLALTLDSVSSFDDLAIKPLTRVLDSRVSGSLLVAGSLDPLSVASDLGSSFMLLLKF